MINLAACVADSTAACAFLACNNIHEAYFALLTARDL
jgi:hypothetical protein